MIGHVEGANEDAEAKQIADRARSLHIGYAKSETLKEAMMRYCFE